MAKPQGIECRFIEPQLSAWVDGQLDERQAQLVREHVAACPGCWGELQVLDAVGTKLKTLQVPPKPAARPPSVRATIRALPWWLVALAVVQRWVMVGGGLGLVSVAVTLLFIWSGPMPATLSLQGRSAATQTLAPGTTVVASAGQTAELSIMDGRGRLTLQGPGALVVREAAVGRLRSDQRLEVSLPNGVLAIYVTPRSAPHELRIMTPQAQVRLTGTHVVIQANPLLTQLQVVEGSAQLTSLATKERITVGIGQVAQVKAGWLSVAPMPTADWLIRKGIISAPDQAPSLADAQPPSAPEPLSYESTQGQTQASNQ